MHESKSPILIQKKEFSGNVLNVFLYWFFLEPFEQNVKNKIGKKIIYHFTFEKKYVALADAIVEIDHGYWDFLVNIL